MTQRASDHLLVVLVSLATVACTSGPSDADGGGDTTGTTDAATGSAGDTSSGAADPGTSTTADDSSGGTTGDDVDPADLPFGGYAALEVFYYAPDDAWFTYSYGDFFEVEYSDDPSYVPDPLWVHPVAVGEDEWTDPAAPVMPPEATITDLDAGQRLDTSTSDFDLMAMWDADQGIFASEPLDLAAAFSGGSTTVHLQGGADLPAGDLVRELPASDANAIVIVRDPAGVPTSITWTPTDATAVVMWTQLYDGDNFVATLCQGSLVDDGEVELPASCLPTAEQVGDDWFIQITSRYYEEVAHAGHRIRLVTGMGVQDDLAYPFVPG